MIDSFETRLLKRLSDRKASRNAAMPSTCKRWNNSLAKAGARTRLSMGADRARTKRVAASQTSLVKGVGAMPPLGKGNARGS